MRTGLARESNALGSAQTACGILVAALGLFSACVDTTPPWSKVAARGGAGGAGGDVLDGAAGTGGALDGGAGGVIDTGGPASGGAGGAIDAPPSGVGGAIDAGRGGAGGGIDSGGVDVPLAGAGGGGGSPDVPLPGTGGVVGSGGASSRGGTSGRGGTTGAGGSNAPDVGPDLAPDVTAGGVEAGALLSGLVAYYKFEGANPDGVTVPDQSGNGNDGTLGLAIPPDGAASGTGYSFAGGKVGNALVLTATGYGYMAMPAKVFAGATDITIAAWVKVTTTQAYQRVFDVGLNANLYNNTNTGTKYMNFVTSTVQSRPTFSITANGSQNEQTINNSTAIATGTWTHFAVVLGSGGATLYRNGASVRTSTSVTLRPKDLGAIDYAWIGRSQFGADPTFDGAIDDLRVYNRALAAAEIAALNQFTGP